MNRDNINDALRQIFADMFDQPPESFVNETSPDTLLEWDSLAHLQLMAAIEEKFELSLAPEDQVDMLNFELIGDVVVDRVEARP